MKFSCQRKDILKKISIGLEVTASRNILSVYSSLLLDVSGGKAKLRSTDMEVSFTSEVKVGGADDGRLGVNAQKLNQVVSSLPDGEIDFSSKDSSLKIVPRSKDIQSQVTLRGIPDSEFPTIPAPENTGAKFEIPLGELQDMIDKTLFAVSHDETRFFLNGVLFDLSGKEVRLIGTDGKRLSYTKTTTTETMDKLNAIVPRKVLGILAKIETSDTPVTVRVGAKNVSFDIDDVTLTSTLIEGKFPNYEQVIPRKNAYEIDIPRETFLESLKRVSIVGDDKTMYVKIKIDGGRFSLHTKSPDLGESQDSFDAESEINGQFEAGFNYSYLLDALRRMKSTTVKMEFDNPKAASILREAGNKNFLYLVMPIEL